MFQPIAKLKMFASCSLKKRPEKIHSSVGKKICFRFSFIVCVNAERAWHRYLCQTAVLKHQPNRSVFRFEKMTFNLLGISFVFIYFSLDEHYSVHFAMLWLFYLYDYFAMETVPVSSQRLFLIHSHFEIRSEPVIRTYMYVYACVCVDAE